LVQARGRRYYCVSRRVETRAKHRSGRTLTPWEVISRMEPSLLRATGEQATRNLSIFAPVSPPAESIRDLSILVFAITGFIFLVVEGVLLYCIVRSRRRA